MWSSRRSYEATTCIQIIFISKKQTQTHQASAIGAQWPLNWWIPKKARRRERETRESKQQQRADPWQSFVFVPSQYPSIPISYNTNTKHPSPTTSIHLSGGGLDLQIANKGGHRDIGKDFMCMCLLWSFVTKYDPALEKNLPWCLQSQRGSEGGNLGTLSKPATFLTRCELVLILFGVVWKRFLGGTRQYSQEVR